MIHKKFPQRNFRLDFKFKNSKGFTLVELLIVLAIMLILLSIALASFMGFGTRNRVRNAALELKTDLRKYQTFAQTGQKNPNGDAASPCDDSVTMESYTVVITGSSYQATLHCTGGVTVPLPAVSVPNGVSLSSCTIVFLPIDQGRDISGCGGGTDVFTTVTDGSTTYQVHVTQTGSIYERKL